VLQVRNDILRVQCSTLCGVLLQYRTERTYCKEIMANWETFCRGQIIFGCFDSQETVCLRRAVDESSMLKVKKIKTHSFQQCYPDTAVVEVTLT